MRIFGSSSRLASQSVSTRALGCAYLAMVRRGYVTAADPGTARCRRCREECDGGGEGATPTRAAAAGSARRVDRAAAHLRDARTGYDHPLPLRPGLRPT